MRLFAFLGVSIATTTSAAATTRRGGVGITIAVTSTPAIVKVALDGPTVAIFALRTIFRVVSGTLPHKVGVQPVHRQAILSDQVSIRILLGDDGTVRGRPTEIEVGGRAETVALAELGQSVVQPLGLFFFHDIIANS